MDDKLPKVLSDLTIDESAKRCGLSKNKTHLLSSGDVNQIKKFWNDFNKIFEVAQEGKKYFRLLTTCSQKLSNLG